MQNGLSKKQMQKMGLSRRQAVMLHREHSTVTVEHVAKEISKNGKWARKIVPSQYAVKHTTGTHKMGGS